MSAGIRLRRPRRLRGGLAVAAAAALVATLVAPAPLGASGPAGPACGAPVAKASGGNWTCTFADEFSGANIDTTKWHAYTSIPGGFRGGDECYSPNNVTIASGALQLTATGSATTFDCAGVPAKYRSGMLLTNGLFSQAYGRFEMRAKIPAGVGFQPAFWMLPQTPYGSRGYSYGEIDVMEAWGTFPGIASPHLHYVSTPGTPMSGNYCLVPTSATAYHTYAVEWTSTRMTFTYDGRTCWSTGWKPIAGYQPAGSAAPAPFDQKFYLIVNLAMGGATTPTNRASVLTRFPATMSVDYIRAWK